MLTKAACAALASESLEKANAFLDGPFGRQDMAEALAFLLAEIAPRDFGLALAVYAQRSPALADAEKIEALGQAARRLARTGDGAHLPKLAELGASRPFILSQAAGAGNLDALGRFPDMSAQELFCALCEALSCGQTQCARYLAGRGANVNLIAGKACDAAACGGLAAFDCAVELGAITAGAGADGARHAAIAAQTELLLRMEACGCDLSLALDPKLVLSCACRLEAPGLIAWARCKGLPPPTEQEQAGMRLPKFDKDGPAAAALLAWRESWILRQAAQQSGQAGAPAQSPKSI